MPVVRFDTDLRCFLANGETETLYNFEVTVEVDDASRARDHVRTVATEMVHDGGSKLLDAPLDRLEVIRTKQQD